MSGKSKSVKFKTKESKTFKLLKKSNTNVSLDRHKSAAIKQKKPIFKKRSQSIPMTSTSTPILQINGLDALQASVSLENVWIQNEDCIKNFPNEDR